MKFGDILRELIETHNISQKQAANDLNIAVSTLGNYICNARQPDYETLKNIAAYFRVTTDYLLDFHTTPKKTHGEDQLLHIYQNLSADHQQLFIEDLLQK